MQTITFNNKQLLFVPVPMEAKAYRIHQLYNNWLLITDGCQGYYKLPDNDVDYDILGTIQKENGNVSTTIDYEMMLFFTEMIGYECTEIEAFVYMMESQNHTLHDSKKYVVL